MVIGLKRKDVCVPELKEIELNQEREGDKGEGVCPGKEEVE